MQKHTILLILAIAAPVACDVPTEQPFPFNHRIHAENEVTCDICHEFVFDKPFAGMPRVETCLGCHEDDIVSNEAAKPYIERVRAASKADTEMGWKKLYRLPRHVYYSHRRHAKIAKIECQVCHGDIGRSSRPPDRPVEKTLTMENCMDCHEKHGVPHDCALCHR